MLITSTIVICSLAGWYLVLTKYLELKAMLKMRDKHDNHDKLDKHQHTDHLATEDYSQTALYNPDKFVIDQDFLEGKHIPGMGPPPLSNMPFNIPPEVLARMQIDNNSLKNSKSEAKPNVDPAKKSPAAPDTQRRLVCNWACLLHLSGLSLVTGIPFVNIIIPTILWLLKKEQHSYLAKQGREVINFQITLTVIQFMCLGLGAFFIWLFPNTAAGLFAWTKTVRVVFATSMVLPFNIFTAFPFFWGCVMSVRGAVAAYHGVTFQYPYSQQFVFENNSLQATKVSTPPVKRKEPSMQKVNFG